MRDAEAAIIESAARLDDPVDGARRRHVHHERVVTAAACEGRRRRAERGVAFEGARHKSTSRAIVRDAEAAIIKCAARIDGPVDGARRRHVHHERVVTAAACEGRRAERFLAGEGARHESPSRALVRDAEALGAERAARLDYCPFGPHECPWRSSENLVGRE